MPLLAGAPPLFASLYKNAMKFLQDWTFPGTFAAASLVIPPEENLKGARANKSKCFYAHNVIGCRRVRA